MMSSVYVRVGPVVLASVLALSSCGGGEDSPAGIASGTEATSSTQAKSASNATVLKSKERWSAPKTDLSGFGHV